MRTIRTFYRQFNINTTRAGVAKLRKTLRHSLRLPSTDNSKNIEWDESLSSGNLLWFNGSIAPLESYSLEERQAIFDAIAPKPKLRNQSRLKAQRRQLKHKVKKAYEVERKNGNDYVADVLWEFYHKSTDAEIPESLVTCLDTMTTMTRHTQKVKMLRKFVSVHNRLIETRPNENATYLQEGIFKIPHKWSVDDSVITPAEWINFTKHCLTHFFPKYPIHALVVHCDERLKDEYTGSHCHYFLSGRDSMFGNWDILKTQIEVVNEYIREQNKLHEERGEELEVLLPENCVLTQEQSAIHGERLQRMFLDHINQHLLNERGLHSEVSSEEERSSPEWKEMNRQAPSAKLKRKFNYLSRQIEEMERQLDRKKSEFERESEGVELAKSEKQQVMVEVAEAKSAFQSEQSQRNEELERLEQKIKALNFKGIRLGNITEKLSDAVGKQLVSLMRQAYIAVQYQKRGQHQKANDYFNRLSERLDNELDLDIKPIIQSVIDAIESTNLDNSNNNEVTYD
ncbi:hypothetical protein ACPV5T_18165 [Vibrio astriarenae]